MAGYNPGDIFIDAVTVTSPRGGSRNLAPQFLSAEVTETIFTPGCSAQIRVIDFDDYLGTFGKLTGDETVKFSFRKPNGGSATYNLHLNSVKEAQGTSADKSKTYILDGISEEVFHGQAKHVQKAFNTTIDSIVKDVFGELGSKSRINAEPTKGKRNIKLANQPVFHAIEMLRKEAVSEKNKSSNFMFWQTHSGFHFKSIEEMMSGGDVKTFKRSNTVGANQNSDVDSNALAYKLLHSMDAINRIHNGAMNQRVSTFNTHTNTFTWKDIKPKGSDLRSLGQGVIMTAAFIEAFSSGMRAVFRPVNHNEDVEIDKSHVPETIPHKMMDLARMQEQTMHMTVIGDTVLEAGSTINNNIPKITADRNNKEPDSQAGGRWIISKLKHEIKGANDRPRWVTHLECIKGSYEEGV
ncbi:hypothetical protein UFOVP132_109 [uncultured Caudovirales phage]|uniref:Uncharacterized protein n=1 Tax=uncultured Caudovirales phage TaxID=2100421 RepID=A0A6J5LAA3_9CAUD|nr:hypothetical protein UFOVP132_109 [uncultured Caudovirales phage]